MKQTFIKKPDQELSELLVVTKPSQWILIFTILLIVAGAFAWSIFGRMSITVKGNGVFLNQSGISEIRATFSGTISHINVETGDYVQQGQILAWIDLPELNLEISALESRIEKKSEHYLFLLDNQDEIRRKQTINQLKEIVELAKVNQAGARVKVDSVWKPVIEIQNSIFELQHFSASYITDLNNEIENLSLQLSEKKNQYSIQSQLRSPFDGVVVELAMTDGDFFSKSDVFCKIENTIVNDAGLSALLYVEATEAKKLKPGMPVMLQPSMYSREEYGYLMGYVYYVSRYPATKEGMNRAIRNDGVVNVLAQGEMPLAVEVRFYTDSTPSGFQWSNGKGPDARIVSGTFASASIIVDIQKPIEVFIPITRFK